MQLNSAYRLLNKIKNVFLTLTLMIFLLAFVGLEASDSVDITKIARVRVEYRVAYGTRQ